jgi:hypothetical protein
MGDWHISIRGRGMHHNGRPDDADVIAQECVARLSAAYQTVHEATITVGQPQSLLYPPSQPVAAT